MELPSDVLQAGDLGILPDAQLVRCQPARAADAGSLLGGETGAAIGKDAVMRNMPIGDHAGLVSPGVDDEGRNTNAVFDCDMLQLKRHKQSLIDHFK